jgi:serine/tyrosine/threonine adenylyltransferase
MKQLNSLIFKNTFIDTFPGDDTGNLQPRQTPGVLYCKALPTPVAEPTLIGWSDVLASQLGISPANAEDIKILGGNLVTPTMYPYAACYAGHQFGNWAGQLGDGRAITLGEFEALNGRSWELQLKGAGLTPYSRRADGRAVLRSSVREYLMSEAMYHLNVPTTRALSLVSTGEPVLRDMFYNGNAQYEPGAIVARLAPSFLRFGNFEILASRDEKENLRNLVDWTIAKFYPHITGEDKVLTWFKEIVKRTAILMTEWLRVGFVHGVMNTDNMSILGLTIDYGPFSFLDEYDPAFTPNTTDLPGRRYAYGQQAGVAQWNLGCLAGALAPLFEDKKPLVEAIEAYEEQFWTLYYHMKSNKLGFDKVRSEDIELIDRFETFLANAKPDMTIFYVLLAELPLDIDNKEETIKHFNRSFYSDLSPQHAEELFTLIQLYQQRIMDNKCTYEVSRDIMAKTNPRFILRNYLLHQSIQELENGNNELFLKLQEALKDPYSNKYDDFMNKRPDWANEKAGCSMLSCSS